ncbi:hypothetical protein H0H92_001668 [Tricholoma furcatifolium]|nr:hypothetical protein H0H92_001668 [Tricholoma furcatifolium]
MHRRSTAVDQLSVQDDSSHNTTTLFVAAMNTGVTQPTPFSPGAGLTSTRTTRLITRMPVKRRPRERKNCMDVDERRRQLEDDEWTLEVRSHIVKCRGCEKWIRLDQRNEYYAGLWLKHQDLCRGIKIMQGQVVPKRTRKPRATAAPSPRNRNRLTSQIAPVSNGSSEYANDSLRDQSKELSRSSSPGPSTSDSCRSSSNSSRASSRSSSERLSVRSGSHVPSVTVPMYYPNYDPRATGPTPYNGCNWVPYGVYYAPAPQPIEPLRVPEMNPFSHIPKAMSAEVESDAEEGYDDDEQVFAPGMSPTPLEKHVVEGWIVKAVIKCIDPHASQSAFLTPLSKN